MFEDYYSNLNPKDYWDFELQKSLAKESLMIAAEFCALKGDTREIEPPYEFTKLCVYHEAYSMVAQIANKPTDWCFAPDCNGGIAVLYLGTKSKVFAIDITSDFNVGVEYFTADGVYGKTVFSYEVPVELKIIDIRKLK